MEKRTEEFYQHGDVLLVRTDTVPKNAKKTQQDRCVLAEGEATGHQHVAEGDCALMECDGERFLHVESPTRIAHHEHAPQVVPPGNYLVRTVREADPFENAVRSVRD